MKLLSLSFPESVQFTHFVGWSPWTAADALVGSLRLDEAYFPKERVQGVCPRLRPFK
jgi:hypothetical protein